MNNLPILVVVLETDNPGDSLPNLISAANAFDHTGSHVIELLYIGSHDDLLPQTAADMGVSKFFHLETSLVKLIQKSFLSALASFLRNKPALAILFDHTPLALEVSTQIAAVLKTQPITSVDSISTDNGRTTAARRILAGNAKQIFDIKDQLVVMTINTTNFSAANPVAGDHSLESIAVTFSPVEEHLHVLSSSPVNQYVALEHSRVIVAGGRGLLNNYNPAPTGLGLSEVEQWKFEQGFELLKTLASQLNGSVAVTRSLVDSGFAPYDLQVGQTGKTVAPDIYIACGISGAIQHTMGMRRSKLIIAINNDPQAPIFEAAHYGVVGDMYKILPEWIALRK